MRKEVKEETHSAQERATLRTRYPTIKVISGRAPRTAPERGGRGMDQCGRPPPARPRTHSGLREGALCRPRDGGLSPSLPGVARLRATVSFYVVERDEDRVHVILAAVSGG